MSLHGSAAVVTGSSRGIGAAIAEALAEQGARVAVHGRDHHATLQVRDRIRRAGGEAIAITGELTDWTAVAAIRDHVAAELGTVDILVANAGGSATPPCPVEDLTAQQWNQVLGDNLTATFLTIKAFLPGMKAAGVGTIITMSSAAARRPDARSPIGYAAAKAGIELLTQSVAAQAGPYGVRVNCLAPETILTTRNRQQIPTDVQRDLAARHPLQRLGTPEDVAAAATFLASEHSTWITGIVLDIAGGSVLV